MTISDYLRNYWPIIATIATMAITMVVRDTNTEARVAALEDRASRQSSAIMVLQTQVANIQTDVSGMKATIDAINSNVSYIRSRIDKITPQ